MAIPFLIGAARLLAGGVGKSAFSVQVTGDFDPEKWTADLEEIKNEVGEEIKERCVRRTVRVDTGEMKDGWYFNPGDNWEVGNTAEHTIHNEFGTYKMSATPMLRPSLEEAQDILNEAVERRK